MAVKALRARQAFLSFQKHQSLGTFPPAINLLKTPTVQCSQEYLTDPAAKSSIEALDAVVLQAKKTTLSKFLTIKESEHAYLADLVSTDKAGARIKNCIDKAFEELAAVLGESPSGGHKQQYSQVKEEVNFMVAHVTNIAFNEQQATLNRKVKKLAVRQKADVEMTDASSVTLAAAIDAVLQKRDAELKNSCKRKGTFSLLDDSISSISNLSSGKKQKTSPPLEPCNSLWPRQGQQKEEEGPVVKKSRRQGYREKIQDEVTGMLDETPQFFNKRKTNTYPPSFFEVSSRARVIFQLLHTSTEELETLRRFSPSVHKGPEVLLP